jgi:hypothetical protein
MKSNLQIALICAVACGASAAGLAADARSPEQSTAIFTVQTTPALRELGGILQGVAAVSTADVWSVGTDILHFNGTAWEAAAKVAGGGTLADVSALAADDVWAAGTLGSAPLAEHWNGKTWTQVPTASLNGNSASFNTILALSAGDVWGAGDVVVSGVAIEPLFEHWNGKTWSVAPGARVAGFIQKLAGTGAGDIWAVGYTTATVAKPLIEHFNGTEWQQVTAPFPGIGGQLFGVVALSPTNAWAVGLCMLAKVGSAQQFLGSPVQTLIEHWDGQSWQVVPTPNIGTPSVFQRNVLYGIAALSATDIWTAGQFQLPDGSGSQLTLALHWNGTIWSIAPVPDVGLANGYRGVAVAQPSTVFLVGIGAFGGGIPDQSPLISATNGG